MKAWLHKAKCWFDDRAHMLLYSAGACLEGLDLTSVSAPITELLGHKAYSGIVLALFAVGMWRAKVTHARGKEMKAEIKDLKQQVEQTGTVLLIPEKDPSGSI